MKYHFKVHKESDGYWAECIELAGCFTLADTLEELQVNMEDALNVYIDEPENSKDLAALPDSSIKLTKTVVEVPLDPSVAVAFILRSLRLKNRWTQNQVAKKMGFEKVYSYQRLESGKSNPSLKMLTKIKEIFPDFSLDYALSI